MAPRIQQPSIDTSRFTLRPIRAYDAALVHREAGDERLARNTRRIPHPMSLDSAEAFVQSCMADDRTEDVWVMDGSAYGRVELLGLIGLDRMGDGRSEVGFWVASREWGGGLATEALGALLAANPHGCHEVVAGVFEDNLASMRVLEKCGFERCGGGRSFSQARGVEVTKVQFVRKME